MQAEPLNYTFIFGACTWCVLSVMWLLALEKSAKARWMHQLHALLPVVAIGGYMLMAKDSGLAVATEQWFVAGMAIIAILTPVWLLTLLTRNAGVMDVVYSLAVSLSTMVLLIVDGNYSVRQIVLMVLVAVWSGRLVHHASGTNLGSNGEQQPYAKWRVQFGSRWWWWSYFQVFLLQGGLVWIWMLPIVLAISAKPGPLGTLDVIGIAVWLIGFVFQAGADWQLKRFKANPSNKGKVLQSGLWSLSRHPNYFGEAVMWWGYFAFGLANPYGWLGIIGPIYVTWFMSKGSAAPMLDRHMLKSKVDYAQYVARVPSFFPFFKSPGDAALLKRFQDRRSS
ncbi:MAG: DUF1295 domain-containing protein [Polaromonas sp.]